MLNWRIPNQIRPPKLQDAAGAPTTQDTAQTNEVDDRPNRLLQIQTGSVPEDLPDVRLRISAN